MKQNTPKKQLINKKLNEKKTKQNLKQENRTTENNGTRKRKTPTTKNGSEAKLGHRFCRRFSATFKEKTEGNECQNNPTLSARLMPLAGHQQRERGLCHLTAAITKTYTTALLGETAINSAENRKLEEEKKSNNINLARGKKKENQKGKCSVKYSEDPRKILCCYCCAYIGKRLYWEKNNNQRK